MDTDIKVDVSLSEALNAGPNEVTMVSSLRRDAANVGAKEISVDESHRSEAVMLSRPPAPTVRCYDSIIDISYDIIPSRFHFFLPGYYRHVETQYVKVSMLYSD